MKLGSFLPRRGALGPLRWAMRTLHNEILGFRFDYPIENVAGAGARDSLHYYVYSDRLFFDAVVLDEGGIPLPRYRTVGEARNPAFVAWYGLVMLHRWLGGLDDTGKAAFFRQVDWLVEHAVHRDDGAAVWPYLFDWREGHCQLRAPWICGMAQGLAISALVRAYRMTGRRPLLDLARAAALVFDKGIDDGGVRTFEGGHAVYEEYPAYPLARVLDGFLFILLGLWDLAVESGDAGIHALFTDGTAGLRHTLDFWDYRGRWSWYGAHGYLCPPQYNTLNAALLRALSDVAGAPALRERADRWHPRRRGLLARLEIFTVYVVTKNLSRLRHRTWRR